MVYLYVCTKVLTTIDITGAICGDLILIVTVIGGVCVVHLLEWRRLGGAWNGKGSAWQLNREREREREREGE